MEERLFDLSKYIPGFRIDDSNRAALCFREILIVALKDDSVNDVKQIGGYCIQVELIGPEGREFLVHVHSSMNIDGYFGGTKLIGSMTDRLQCLEEKYTEFIYKENGLHEKSLFVGLEEDAYHVEITRACPCSISPLTESKNLKLHEYENLIGEGANVLLMRYLAITNFEGAFRVQNITINGEIITNDYICTALRDVELYGSHRKIYTVERKTYKEDKLIQGVKIYLTSRGQILVYDWLDMPYVVQKNPLIHDEANENMQIPLREWWTQDIEMLSKYLDTKSCNIAQYMDYLADHPEVKQLIADYVQTLLVVKPIDVINFTIQHFKAFAREPKVWDTEQSDIEINLHLSRDQSDTACDLCRKICIKRKIHNLINCLTN